MPLVLSLFPLVYSGFLIAGLLWRSNENRDDISAILEALNTEIDMAVLHDGLPPGNKHSLLSMVCYFGQHFICFAHSHEHKKWIMYDDETVKLIGCWDDVISMCEGQHLQPQLLFFEAVKNRDGNSNRSYPIHVPRPTGIGVPGITSLIGSYLEERNKNRSGIGLQAVPRTFTSLMNGYPPGFLLYM